MRSGWFFVLTLLGAVAAPAKDAPDAGTSGSALAAIRKVEAPEFKAALEKARASGKFTLIDVREPDETAAGFVPGAELMPYSSGVFAREHGKIPKDRPVLLYCAIGRRAGRAAEMLVAEGWKDVTVLSGGGYEDLRPPGTGGTR
ncbi:MAG TPA: rhodanese-like domain-containing protein [Myxococcaceae bacterium]|nr:rhodanese-like domain-containing protein [Myxococcaceae bacterium]